MSTNKKHTHTHTVKYTNHLSRQETIDSFTVKQYLTSSSPSIATIMLFYLLFAGFTPLPQGTFPCKVPAWKVSILLQSVCVSLSSLNSANTSFNLQFFLRRAPNLFSFSQLLFCLCPLCQLLYISERFVQWVKVHPAVQEVLSMTQWCAAQRKRQRSTLCSLWCQSSVWWVCWVFLSATFWRRRDTAALQRKREGMKNSARPRKKVREMWDDGNGTERTREQEHKDESRRLKVAGN